MKMHNMGHSPKWMVLFLVLTSNGFASGDEGHFVEIGKECPPTAKICIYSLLVEERFVLQSDAFRDIDPPPMNITDESACRSRGGHYVSDSDKCYLKEAEVRCKLSFISLK